MWGLVGLGGGDGRRDGAGRVGWGGVGLGRVGEGVDEGWGRGGIGWGLCSGAGLG